VRVSHNQDHDTHAVIGGKDIQEFGISASSQFFEVLSNAMYSNKPLAVAREVLCNAWDSHIVSDVRHLPVKVDITEDKMTFRDYGAGIPHDLIHQIFCVYGNSTKGNDGNQTGGFGLGSKAPFAYSEHFTVTNHHAGLKTVHAISRGSARTQGKPDRRVIVSVPTTETGIEVMVPLKTAQDKFLFEKLVRDVASFGEMNVLLNGQPVQTVPISQAENNMFLTTSRPGSLAINKINVRYGNVVYPVLPDVEYIGTYNRLIETLKEIPGTDSWGDSENSFALIMQAEANTISVTPSRESLSLTDTTIETLKLLMNNLADHMSTNTKVFETLLMAEQEKCIEHYFRTGMPERLLTSKNLLLEHDAPGRGSHNRQDDNQIMDIVSLASYFLRYKKKLGVTFSQKMATRRVEALFQGGYRRREDLRKFLKIRSSVHSSEQLDRLFLKKILRPMANKINGIEGASAKHLYVVSPNHNGRSRMGWYPAAACKPGFEQALGLMQGVMVVSHNRLGVEQDWDSIMNVKRHFKLDKPFLCYVAPRTKGTKDAVVAEYQRQGFLVLDFADAMDKYTAARVSKAVHIAADPTPRKPKNVGLVLLSNNVKQQKWGKNFFINAHLNADAPRSEDYEYIHKPVNITGKGYSNAKFWSWEGGQDAEIASLFGSQIGICVSEPQYESQLKKGKKPAEPMILARIKHEVLTNPGVRAYVELSLGQGELMGIASSALMEMAGYSERIRALVNIPPVGPETDLTWYNIYKSMANCADRGYHRHSNDPWIKMCKEISEEVAKWTVPKAYTDLAKRVNESKGLDMLDLSDMKRTLQKMHQSKSTDIKMKTFIEMSIINALNI
jgi:hypothetical protein